MKTNLQRKLAIGFGICVLLMAVLVLIDIWTLLKLETLYRETFRRGIEMELATDAQHIGEDLYVIIANSAINRNLSVSARLWSDAKAENRNKLDLVAKAADDSQERQKVETARVAFEEIIKIYEQEMLPLIEAGAGVPGPLSEIDARIDERIDVIDRSLEAVARSMSAENALASQSFHSVLAHSITVGVSISLLGVLAALLISALTTRRVVRPLREITNAAHEVARGNYQVELPYRSRDEAGVLAHAFRTMIAEVARRSVELQKSNDALNREVQERKLSQEEVVRLNEELEERVRQRTAELVQANEQLEAVIKAQREVEQELHRSRTELRSLSQHLQEVREEERTGIARVIHDELGQMLTALKIDLSWIRKKLPPEQRQLLDKTVELSKHIDDTIGTVQRISAELRPGILDDLGLTAAMEWQAQEFQQKTGISCQIKSDVQSVHLERRSATELFRIFQESLTNIYRHSAASRAVVSLRQAEDSLTMIVTDNGKGISEEKLADPKSLGLIGMRERVHNLGGKLAISRLPHGGTKIRVSLPFNPETDKEITAHDQNPGG